MVDSSAAQKWVALFADDCNVTYPFGTHIRVAALADWCLNAETRLQRMRVSGPPVVLRSRTLSGPLRDFIPSTEPNELVSISRFWDEFVCSTSHPTSRLFSHLKSLPMAAPHSSPSAGHIQRILGRISPKEATITGAFARSATNGGYRISF